MRIRQTDERFKHREVRGKKIVVRFDEKGESEHIPEDEARHFASFPSFEIFDQSTPAEQVHVTESEDTPPPVEPEPPAEPDDPEDPDADANADPNNPFDAGAVKKRPGRPRKNP